MNKRDLLKKVYNSKNNVIVNGRINSRKTYGVMFPLMDIILENNESFFVLDSKEEYFRRYYNGLKSNGYQTVIINLRNSLASDGWNPLTYAYSLYCSNHIDEATRSIEKIADVLFDHQVEDRFWAISSKNVFLGLIWFLFENAKESEINFNSVVELLDSFADNEVLFKGDSHACKLLSSITKAPEDTKRSVISIVRQELTKYTNYPNLSKMLATPMQRIDLSRKFCIIFINRDEDLYFNNLAAIFIDQFYDFLQKSNYDLQFNFILDNYETIIDDYDNLDILLYSGPSRKVRTIISTSETLDYLDNVCERIESTEESVKFSINKEDSETSNDYERIDLSQIVKYPTLDAHEIKVFTYGKTSTAPTDFSMLTSRLSAELKRIEEQEAIDFTTFINTHDFRDMILNDEKTSNSFLKFLDQSVKDEESDKEFDELVKSIDEEIARLEKEGVSDEKNDFEKFLEEFDYNEMKDKLYKEKTENSFEKLLEAIDKEISLLEEKVDEENKDDFADIIKRIDEEIERLEQEEDVKEEAEDTRNDFVEFLNSHNFIELIDDEEDLDELIKSIDEEIKRIEENGVSEDKNEFEKFLEENSYDEVDDKIDLEEDAYNQLLEAIDKEISLLEEKVTDENKDEFNEIIKRIDEEIERLEKEEDLKEDVEDTKNDFIEFLNTHDFSDAVSDDTKAKVIEIK